MLGDAFGLPNLALNGLAVALVIAFAWPVLKGRRKDAAIADLEVVLKGRSARIEELLEENKKLREDVRQIEQGAGHLQVELAAVQAAYEEQSKYTAKHALEAVMQVIAQNDKAHERRHEEIMQALGTLGTAVERE